MSNSDTPPTKRRGRSQLTESGPLGLARNAYTVAGAVVLLTVGPNLQAKIDAADFPRVSQYRWVAWEPRPGAPHYVRAFVRDWPGSTRQVPLHRFLLRPERGHDVHHRNHNPLDCTRGNLETVTRAENLRARRTWADPKPPKVVPLEYGRHFVGCKLPGIDLRKVPKPLFPYVQAAAGVEAFLRSLYAGYDIPRRVLLKFHVYPPKTGRTLPPVETVARILELWNARTVDRKTLLIQARYATETWLCALVDKRNKYLVTSRGDGDAPLTVWEARKAFPSSVWHGWRPTARQLAVAMNKANGEKPVNVWHRGRCVKGYATSKLVNGA